MKIRDVRQWIHDKDDDEDVEIAVEGVVYSLGTILHVPEWNTVYLGMDEDDLNDTLISYTHEESGEADDDEEPSSDDEVTAEDMASGGFREEFLEALARDEDAAVANKAKGTDVLGDCCQIPQKKEVVPPVSTDTETM
jgi:hypothetical protein